jgi:hypothetical protein
MDFLAQASLGADAKAITNDQHPDHQFGIDRWATHRAVKGGQLQSQLVKLDEPVDGPQNLALAAAVQQPGSGNERWEFPP